MAMSGRFAFLTSFRQMARRKTTVYVDEELLRGIKVMAARTDRSDSEVETAIRRYLGLEVLTRIWAERGDLAEDEALALAYEEIDAVRNATGRR
jgi:Ribbon-helix-helix protein, copG family